MGKIITTFKYDNIGTDVDLFDISRIINSDEFDKKLWDCDREQLEYISCRLPLCFAVKNKECADFLQFVISSTGSRCKMRVDENGEYELYINSYSTDMPIHRNYCNLKKYKTIRLQ